MAETTPRVLLDCDPGIDDALALAYLAALDRDGEIDLSAIVCTAGNVILEDTVRNALSWLDLAQAPTELPVAAGAAGPISSTHPFTPDTHGVHGSGYAELPHPQREPDPRSGAELWVDTVRAHPGQLIAILTGPSSTLAQALKLEPKLPLLLRQLVVMGGAFLGYPGNTTPVSEWNIDVDPEAADTVCGAWTEAIRLDSTVAPIQWFGLNLTEQAVWTPERSASLIASGDTALRRNLVDALRFYFEFHESVGEGYLAHVHDPLVAWLAVNPGSAKFTPAQVRVECVGIHTRGMTVADTRLRGGEVANSMIASALTVLGGAQQVLDEISRRL